MRSEVYQLQNWAHVLHLWTPLAQVHNRPFSVADSGCDTTHSGSRSMSSTARLTKKKTRLSELVPGGSVARYRVRSTPEQATVAEPPVYPLEHWDWHRLSWSRFPVAAQVVQVPEPVQEMHAHRHQDSKQSRTAQHCRVGCE